MTPSMPQLTSRQAALTAGISLLVMVAAVIVALPNTVSLITAGDAAKTVQAIQQAGIRFHLGILGWFVVLVCDLIVAWALYMYFKPVHAGLSQLTAWLRLFYTAIFGVMIFNFVIVLLMLQGKSYLNVFTQAQFNALALLFLTIYKYGWLFALGFFGIHLLGLGVLALRSNKIPMFFGIALVIAGLGYLGDTLAFIALPNYGSYESTIKAIVGAPNAIGELAFAAWLLWKGGRD
ncbi:MAG: DUF4386 domain-containing protein [Deltaproteobacteria bacterium]|nr:MAG: DUF4386 domain-containing protein [Deltaproteobacteria bacterium]